MLNSFLKPLFSDIKTFVLDTLFPKRCLSCETEGEFLCLDCKANLKVLEHQRCIVCQKPSPFGLTHPRCLTPHGADGLISFFNYHDEKVAQILIKGKYSFLPEVYKILGELIAKKLQSDASPILNLKSYISRPQSPDGSVDDGQVNPIFVPIPLHSWRKRWRGFNQAEVLCQTLSQQLSLPSTSVLVRCKSTKVQKNLKRDERIKNIKDAFALSPKILNHKSEILNQNFILVDDVTTTGATLLEAAKILKRNGAAKVFCLTVARD